MILRWPSHLAEGEHIRLDAAGRERRSRTCARLISSGLADQLVEARLGDVLPSPRSSVSSPWAAPGGSPSISTRNGTDIPGAAGPARG